MDILLDEDPTDFDEAGSLHLSTSEFTTSRSDEESNQDMAELKRLSRAENRRGASTRLLVSLLLLLLGCAVTLTTYRLLVAEQQAGFDSAVRILLFCGCSAQPAPSEGCLLYTSPSPRD